VGVLAQAFVKAWHSSCGSSGADVVLTLHSCAVSSRASVMRPVKLGASAQLVLAIDFKIRAGSKEGFILHSIYAIQNFKFPTDSI
jgi:hypothetical protein